LKMPSKTFMGSVSSPKVDLVVDTGSPLLNLTVDGFLKIGTVAAAKVVVEETYHVVKRVDYQSIMTNSEHPSPPPTLTLVEKLYAVHNINSLIPEKLDLAELNYSTWSYFFKGHCSNFGVLKHIEEPVTEASTSTPPTDV
ncbi:hypothetical protein Tco_0035095, partial [Tanacetum coccineum]